LGDGRVPKSESFHGDGQDRSLFFAAFNSEISERGSELHIRGTESFVVQRQWLEFC
jgi:hypothetical protein